MADRVLNDLVSDAGGVRTTRINGQDVSLAICARCLWGRNRTWEREDNAVTKLAEHLLNRHRVRLVLGAASVRHPA